MEGQAMQNLKESILLSIITTCKTCFIWDNKVETVLAVISVAVIWWCLLTWKDGIIEKYGRKGKQK